VLGLELATGDGRLLRFGGRVVKNVAGYDVVRLVVGSHGALGVVTRVHLRLRPLAARDVTWIVKMHEPDMGAIESITRAVEPGALEWIDGALHVRVQGNAAAIDAAGEYLESSHDAQPLDDDAARRAWRTLAAFEAQAAFVARLQALPSSLPVLIPAARALRDGIERTVGAEATVAAHAGEGIVRVLAAQPASASTADWAALVPALHDARGAARALGGSVRFEMLPPGITGVAAFEPAPDTLPLMRAVRRHFDPAGILLPGAWLEAEHAP
jgi:glycolate oxidase FAD binding subunit